MDSPTCIIHLPEQKPDSAIIWLHGLGADAHDLEPISTELGLHQTRFIFPNAPRRQITINNGAEMRAWFDFTSLDFSGGENAEHIAESIERIEVLINAQIEQGVAAERIVLAGFSQGGVIALMTGLGFDQPLGGIIALSTYIPEQLGLEIAQLIPVIQCHGIDDTVIPYEVGLKTSKRLASVLGELHEWRTYPMEHGVSEEEISDLASWAQHLLHAPVANHATA
jgi:phospholipase/carboxylesterase